MSERCIIGYGVLGKKIFEVLSLKQKIKVYSRSKQKLKNLKPSQKFNNVDEVFENCSVIIFLV